MPSVFSCSIVISFSASQVFTMWMGLPPFISPALRTRFPSILTTLPCLPSCTMEDAHCAKRARNGLGFRFWKKCRSVSSVGNPLKRSMHFSKNSRLQLAKSAISGDVGPLRGPMSVQAHPCRRFRSHAVAAPPVMERTACGSPLSPSPRTREDVGCFLF